MRTCSRCHKKLPATAEFFIKNKQCIGGIARVCRECTRKYARNWGRANRDKTAAQNRIKRKKQKQRNPDLLKARDKRGNLKKYGITLEQYDEMFEAQNGVCAVCGNPEVALSSKNPGVVRRLSVDHNHKTGEIRGLLCSKCNIALGSVNDDTRILMSLVLYLERCKNGR